MSILYYLSDDTLDSLTATVNESAINHIDKALSRLPEQLKRSTVLIAFLKAVLTPMQELEEMFFSLLALKSIDDATDAVLDLIGKLVGQPRNGQADVTYRMYIKVRLAVNRSRGLPSDYVKISSLLFPDANVEVKAKGATAEVTLHGVVLSASDAAIVLGFLQDAHGAGVRVVLHTFPTPEAVAFSYRSVSHLLGALNIGDTSFALITQTDLLTFPPTGYVKIDSEIIQYTINVPSWTLMTIKTPGATANHSASALVRLCDAAGNELNTGRGFGNGFYSSGLESNP